MKGSFSPKDWVANYNKDNDLKPQKQSESQRAPQSTPARQTQAKKAVMPIEMALPPTQGIALKANTAKKLERAFSFLIGGDKNYNQWVFAIVVYVFAFCVGSAWLGNTFNIDSSDINLFWKGLWYGNVAWFCGRGIIASEKDLDVKSAFSQPKGFIEKLKAFPSAFFALIEANPTGENEYPSYSKAGKPLSWMLVVGFFIYYQFHQYGD